MSLLNLKSKTLRIALKAYEPYLLDDSCRRIIDSVRSNGTDVTGPVPLPTKRRIYCVLRSPHVNKDSREHFEIRTHKRLIDVHAPSESTMEGLRNLDIPSGVDIEIRSLA
jgi:small subunit ribosomal protein S10|tara:strand:+ start:846 stop:1175 length:330 start_codon:yes stop_codon:yes gene_type:complete